MATRPEDFPAPFKGGEQNDKNDTRVGETNQEGEGQGHGEHGAPAGKDRGVPRRSDEEDTGPE